MADITASLSAEVLVSVIGQDELDTTFRCLLLVPGGVLRYFLSVEVLLPDLRTLHPGARQHGFPGIGLAQRAGDAHDPEPQQSLDANPQVAEPRASTGGNLGAGPVWLRRPGRPPQALTSVETPSATHPTNPVCRLCHRLPLAELPGVKRTLSFSSIGQQCLYPLIDTQLTTKYRQ